MRALLLLLPALGLSACAHVDTTATAPTQASQVPAASQDLQSADTASSVQLQKSQSKRSKAGQSSASTAYAGEGSYPTLDLQEEESTIWEHLNGGFQISTLSRVEVDYWREYYSQRPKLISAIFERSKPFLHSVVKEVEARDLPMELALLPAIESGFHPFAYSRSHASGLWQFIPITANRFKLGADDWMDLRRDVNASTNAALDYLTYLHGFFNGDWLLAIAAYNAGEGRVRKAVEKNLAAGLPTDFWNLDLPRETRDYVPRLLAMAQIVRDPRNHGLTLPAIPAAATVASVPIQEPLDLGVAARILDMPVDDLKLLNPGLKKFSTPPDREYKLAIPKDKLKNFTMALAQLAPADKQPWERHVLAKGETLESVARRYGVDPDQLRKQNPRETGNYRAGETLLIAQSPVRYPSSFLTSAGESISAAEPGKAKPSAPVLAGLSGGNVPQRISASALSSLVNGTPKAHSAVLAESDRRWSNAEPTGKIREVVVKAGETLFRIAKNANVPLEDLRRWNRLTADDQIRPGQRLVLADSGTAGNGQLFSRTGPTPLASTPGIGMPSRSSRDDADAEHAGQTRKITYVVQLGDTLWSIARRFNVAFHQLLTWNRLGERPELRPGDSITLYVGKQAGKGD
ncbi:MAG: LysM peptidoglycan-binding domain-containing protein [Pseudomonadota bacterium]